MKVTDNDAITAKWKEAKMTKILNAKRKSIDGDGVCTFAVSTPTDCTMFALFKRTGSTYVNYINIAGNKGQLTQCLFRRKCHFQDSIQ
jgi:hypothetical protein